MPAVSTRVPTPGRDVMYHQEELEGEGNVVVRDWPAKVLEVEGDKEGGFTCLLQVFRPRGNHWPRAAEGDHAGGWSWPTLIPEGNGTAAGTAMPGLAAQ